MRHISVLVSDSLLRPFGAELQYSQCTGLLDTQEESTLDMSNNSLMTELGGLVSQALGGKILHELPRYCAS
jgi:hypothetical protein